MTNAMLGAPLHPRKQMKCFADMGKNDHHETSRTENKQEPTPLSLKNRTTEPKSSMHVGTNATRAVSNVTFIR
jgi:hypothetical protein